MQSSTRVSHIEWASTELFRNIRLYAAAAEHIPLVCTTGSGLKPNQEENSQAYSTIAVRLYYYCRTSSAGASGHPAPWAR